MAAEAVRLAQKWGESAENAASLRRFVVRWAVERRAELLGIPPERLAHRRLLAPIPDFLTPAEQKRFRAELDAARERLTRLQDWERCESVGWLYQFLVVSRKTRNRQGVVDARDSAASTGRFTPRWIAEWLVRQTLEPHLAATAFDAAKRMNAPEQKNATEQKSVPEQAVRPPERVTLLDPACGTGHILLAAYSFWENAYRTLGAAKESIPEKILRQLYGLDLDPEAVRLASALLLLRGSETSGRLPKTLPRVFDFSAFPEASVAGSLWRPHPNAPTNGESNAPHLSAEGTLRRPFDAVVTNPPYLGAKGVSRELKAYLRQAGFIAPAQLDGLFIERGIEQVRPGGSVGMITMQSWMFLPTFERLRRKILAETTLETLLHLGVGAFASIGGEVVSTVAFTLRRESPAAKHRPVFHRLTDGGAEEKRRSFQTGAKKYQNRTQAEFADFSCAPLVYEMSERVREFLRRSPKLADYAEIKQGMATGDNRRFLRKRSDVDPRELGLGMASRAEAAASGKRWFPYSKGVGFRKWAAEIPDVIDFADDGRELWASRPKAVIRNPDYFFRPGLSWSFVSTGPFSARLIPAGVIFDVGASMLFPKSERFPGLNEEEARLLLLGWLNSTAVADLIRMINPTLNYQVGDLARLPFDYPLIQSAAERVISIVRELVQIAQKGKEAQNERDSQRTAMLEKENNRIFLDRFGLTGAFPGYTADI